MKQIEDKSEQEVDQAMPSDTLDETDSADQTTGKKGGAGRVLIIILLLIIIAGLGGAGYYGWHFFNQYQQAQQARLDDLQQQLATRPSQSELAQLLRPLQQKVGRSDALLDELQTGQQALTDSTQKLFELYGRDENGWKLAEVEYLLSVAQHKLVLEQDFEGAAKTLQSSSNRTAEMADPGLLPVRVQISDEIAQLKTRVRPDLVGMTLTLARLARQVSVLKPAYVSRPQASDDSSTSVPPAATEELPIDQRVRNFLTSLVTIKRIRPEQEAQAQTPILDVPEQLEDNLKLARWSVLERDARQYQTLIDESVRLFGEHYDLEDAANADVHEQLLGLQKASLKPELPDISGSLQLLRQIQEKRANAPQAEAENG